MNGIFLDAFKLPPKEAIAFLKKKGFRFSWDYTQVWDEMHAQVFTVAKVMRLDILQDIRDGLDSAMADGTSFQKFKKDLKPLLQSKGWWGKQMLLDEKGQGEQVQLGSTRRLQTIYDTNMQSAMAKGRWDGMMEAVDSRPYLQYLHPPIAKVPRPDHVALDGRIFRYDDPFWDTHYPPNGYGCHCRVRSLSERQVKAMGLQVSSGEGNMETKEVLVSERSGLLATVSGYKAPDGQVVWTDPGFNYNSGKVEWTPDLRKYDPALVRQFEKLKE